MKEFIARYWLEVLFGVIAGIAAAIIKRVYNLYKKGKEAEEKIVLDAFDNKIKDFYSKTQGDNEVIISRIDNIENLMVIFKNGLLSVQGDLFKKKCSEYLEDDHELTLDEWLQIVADHDTYKSLGGNHEGDEMFKMLQLKAEKLLTERHEHNEK